MPNSKSIQHADSD